MAPIGAGERHTRANNRVLDNPQVVAVALDGGRVRTVDQFVGDPATVTAL